jgi:predicted house-cleaning NTP pyrophosphatase (Maf/HAM1 superfamily)
MAFSPEQFVKAYGEMVDAARKSGGLAEWKNSPEFVKRVEADWDRVFGSPINKTDTNV